MTIELEDICKSYGSLNVLSHFSLSISDGASFVITGPSGIGKTTLIRILLGLEKPDQGQIHLLGDYRYPCLNAGVVFQEDRLCDDFSAVVNVAMVNKHISAAFARTELEKLLPPEALDKPVRELSGGMRRRVCIVRAVSVPSDILVMDEPFAGLDRENRRRAVRYIRSRQGTTPLLITAHDTEDLEFCRQIRMGES